MVYDTGSVPKSSNRWTKAGHTRSKKDQQNKLIEEYLRSSRALHSTFKGFSINALILIVDKARQELRVRGVNL